ncbi:uncharacterized protein E0L32_004622 [Thyridium curvatum]|uniref:Secreted protein n=1 Tax=Thyridium curvatum TaxID=1093900 RepID=A0A507AX39_9PEZI|nr:uncharacterized protein E0L32_004622 [Thyridium curvatum]TPX15345.1 hypothetical protein E0L32_004622 [Thyridium curvatum]
MKIPVAVLTLWVAACLGQQQTVCTNEMATSDDCADVINPIACYNQFGFNGARTLNCIDGKNDADKKRKVSRSPSFLSQAVLTASQLRRASAAAALAHHSVKIAQPSGYNDPRFYLVRKLLRILRDRAVRRLQLWRSMAQYSVASTVLDDADGIICRANHYNSVHPFRMIFGDK